MIGPDSNIGLIGEHSENNIQKIQISADDIDKITDFIQKKVTKLNQYPASFFSKVIVRNNQFDDLNSALARLRDIADKIRHLEHNSSLSVKSK